MDEEGNIPKQNKLRDLNWVFPAYSAFLFALGGWAMKWLRRYVLPLSGGFLALLYGVRWYRCLLYVVATIGAFSLGYSPERNPMWLIAIISASYGATPLLLCEGWRPTTRWWLWPLLTSITFTGLMLISLNFNWFHWKIVEAVIGYLHGSMVAIAIDRYVKSHPDPDEEEMEKLVNSV
ncbi:MAG: hypothetical protein DRJ03_03380 [Chloroflexi bacterium]|nr:MAG: hypothetical protein DRJ03_03380 [Chloroflexota bacterium]